MATPQLEREKWEKLVCAMFTGAELHDRNREPLVKGSIRSILEKYGPGTFTDPSKYPYYLPWVTALYQEDNKGVIVGEVLVSDKGTHAEEKFIAMSPECLCTIHSIGISYSPCTDKCAKALVERYKDGSLPKPVIHFSWVHKYPYRKSDGQEGYEQLIENGFKLQKWETEKMYEYLLEQAPNQHLKYELQQAYEKTRVALSERDEETHKLIEEAWEDEVLDDVQRRAHLKRPLPVEQQTDER